MRDYAKRRSWADNPGNRCSTQICVEIQHKDRLLANPGTIEDVLAVENDVVPFDRADVLEQDP